MGPAGPRGTRWTTGDGPPTSTAGVVTGDLYLDDTSGAVYQWDGTAWVDTGTNIQGSPDTGADILGKLAPVDGSGSGLDADMVDGQHAVAFAQQTALAAEIAARQAADTSEQTARQNADAALQTSINLKADIASPTFTGDPKAPTPVASDNDTSIATTAFVKANIAALPPPGLSDAPSDGLTYGRKNATWATIVGGAVISDTPPPGPLQAGQLWWESDTGNLYLWFNDGDSSQWVQIPAPAQPTQSFRKRTVITASTATFQFDPATNYADVEVVGGGAGGGPCFSTAAGQGAAGGGGGGGGYAKKLIQVDATVRAATKTITIGAGGGNSTDGSDTTYTDTVNTLTGSGGLKGGSGTAVAAAIYSSAAGGGAGSGGDINRQGGTSHAGYAFGSTVVGAGVAGVLQGRGGDSAMGSGAYSVGVVGSSSATYVGQTPPANNYGAGGSGGASINGGVSTAGGAGRSGVVVVTEYR
jgi:hypothetical protein